MKKTALKGGLFLYLILYSRFIYNIVKCLTKSKQKYLILIYKSEVYLRVFFGSKKADKVELIREFFKIINY
jgi:hypothetical protein